MRYSKRKVKKAQDLEACAAQVYYATAAYVWHALSGLLLTPFFTVAPRDILLEGAQLGAGWADVVTIIAQQLVAVAGDQRRRRHPCKAPVV